MVLNIHRFNWKCLTDFFIYFTKVGGGKLDDYERYELYNCACRYGSQYRDMLYTYVLCSDGTCCSCSRACTSKWFPI